MRSWGRWSVWEDCAWRLDETLRVFDLARKVCRDKSAEVRMTVSRRASQVPQLLPLWSDWRGRIGNMRRQSINGMQTPGSSTLPTESSICGPDKCARTGRKIT